MQVGLRLLRNDSGKDLLPVLEEEGRKFLGRGQRSYFTGA
jgi:hypothetical protein